MALSFTSTTVTELGKEVAKYAIGGLTGTGVTLALLLSWTGAKDLQAIKDSVQTQVTQSSEFAGNMASDYVIEINKANAEIKDYQVALEQANKNIVALKTEYDKMAEMVTEAEANEIIAKANSEIKQANKDVADTRTSVETTLSDSFHSRYENTDEALEDYASRLNELKSYVANGTMSEEEFKEYTGMGTDEFNGDKSVNTGGDKTVVELPEGVTLPTEQPTEQPTEEPTEQPQN